MSTPFQPLDATDFIKAAFPNSIYWGDAALAAMVARVQPALDKVFERRRAAFTFGQDVLEPIVGPVYLQAAASIIEEMSNPCIGTLASCHHEHYGQCYAAALRRGGPEELLDV